MPSPVAPESVESITTIWRPASIANASAPLLPLLLAMPLTVVDSIHQYAHGPSLHEMLKSALSTWLSRISRRSTTPYATMPSRKSPVIWSTRTRSSVTRLAWSMPTPEPKPRNVKPSTTRSEPLIAMP